MAVTAHDIAKVAATLLGDPDEAWQRSAVSRYFYAAYHRCGAWKDALPGAPSSGGYVGGTHQQLINQLRAPDSQCSDPQKKRSRFLATKLQILRARRVVADYQVDVPLLQGEVTNQQLQTDDLLAECDANP